MRISGYFAAAWLAAWLALMPGAAGQTPAGSVISGTVLDALGRPIAAAGLRLQAADGSEIAQTRSDDSGHFSFAAVPAGTYAVTAEKTDFETGTAIVTSGTRAAGPT